MKFCYFDESGMGSEPYLVVAGIIVDTYRMHITKNAWSEFLEVLSKAVGRKVGEFHSRDFYRGNGIWRHTEGSERTKVINAVLTWVGARHHKCLFSSVKKSEFNQLIKVNDPVATELSSYWCTAAIHCLLQVQKHYQHEAGTKGHSVMVFDHEVMEESCFINLVVKPPQWTDAYYRRDVKVEAMHCIVDVPYFAKSEHALLIQVADLLAYILRTHAEIKDSLITEKYTGEGARMEIWSQKISKMALPRTSRYIRVGRNEAEKVFWDLAPEPIREL